MKIWCKIKGLHSWPSRVLWLLLLTMGVANPLYSQTAVGDSLMQVVDSIYAAMADSLSEPVENQSASVSVVKAGNGKTKRDWALWRPDPQRALWLALVLPGGGQIYNRKYWKLPIVYGGFVGCIYAMRWNNTMYRDYAQAYLDLMDDDPGTASYNQFLHLGQQITSSNEERYKSIFKKRKDRFRRWRDLSFFCLVGVYAISVIDAYVDAELSAFDISDDLSMKLRPTVIGGNGQSPFYATSVGVSCQFAF